MGIKNNDVIVQKTWRNLFVMKNFITKNPEIIGIILLFSVALVLGIFRSNYIEKNGIITVCKILRLEGSGGGTDLYLEVYLRGEKYETVINDFCIGCVGEFRYCKIVAGDKKIVNLFNEEVPECILNNLNKYDSGWNKIPKCE